MGYGLNVKVVILLYHSVTNTTILLEFVIGTTIKLLGKKEKFKAVSNSFKQFQII